MEMISRLLFVFILVGVASGLNNGLGRTPQMGKRNSVYVLNLFTLFQVGIVGIIFGVITMRKGSNKQSTSLSPVVLLQLVTNMVCSDFVTILSMFFCVLFYSYS